MQRFSLMIFLIFFLAAVPINNLFAANTVQDFDNPGTNFSLITTFGSTPAQVLPGGPTGNFLRLDYVNVTGTQNFAAFDRTQAGPVNRVVADFDFRMFGASIPSLPADGIGFALLNTAYYGNSGPASWTLAEEPNAMGSLGVGFDIFDNGEFGGNNHFSVHVNGVLRQNLALDPVLQMPLWENNEISFNHAHIVADLLADTVSVALTPQGSVTPIIQVTLFNLGLSPYEARVAFGARTGGATANHDVDNINVSFVGPAVPLPSTTVLFTSGLLGLLPFFRRKK